MNNFFTDNFNISKINLCVLVKNGTGQHIHKNRPSHGLVLQLGGIKKYIFASGNEMTVYAGEVFYLPKFSSYGVLDLEGGDCIAVNFDLYDSDLTYEHFSQASVVYTKNEKRFYNILKNWNNRQGGYLNTCLADLYGIISDIQHEHIKKYVPSKSKNLVLDATDFINRNISDCTLTIQSIADYLGITPEYLRKLFNDTYKISPRKYIIEKRMRKAQELILSQEFLISEISRMCGYDSESYFSSEFKKLCGYSPSDYGNINKNSRTI